MQTKHISKQNFHTKNKTFFQANYLLSFFSFYIKFSSHFIALISYKYRILPKSTLKIITNKKGLEHFCSSPNIYTLLILWDKVIFSKHLLNLFKTCCHLFLSVS